AFGVASGAAYAVVPIDLDDLTAHSARNLVQLPLLIGRGLIEGGDSEIDNGSAHGFSPFQLTRGRLPYIVSEESICFSYSNCLIKTARFVGFPKLIFRRVYSHTWNQPRAASHR